MIGYDISNIISQYTSARVHMDESLTFSVPSFKTKSEIWTYFGFMAESAGIISDKKKIACRICQAVIAYTGNTSNMTHHLQHMHMKNI